MAEEISVFDSDEFEQLVHQGLLGDLKDLEVVGAVVVDQPGEKTLDGLETILLPDVCR